MDVCTPSPLESSLRVELHTIHAGILQALQDELSEYLEGDPRDATPVGLGERVGQRLGWWDYLFAVSVPPGRFKAGKSLGLQMEHALYPAVVVSRGSDSLLLTLGADLGPTIGPCSVLVDSRWLLTALQLRIAELESQLAQGRPIKFNFSTAARTLGLGDLSVCAGDPSGIATHLGHPSRLNSEQRAFVALAHRAPAAYLWGPPGTGKSHTVVHALASLVRAGARVLLVAPTNRAADLILERGDGVFSAEPWWEDGAMLRVGPPDSVTLTDDLWTRYHVDSVVARKLSPGDDALEHTERAVGAARVVCATVAQTYLSRSLMAHSWDVLMVDEASMVSPASLYVAAGLAKRTVIAGDFRQLPPVSRARTDAANEWLRRDPFELLGIPSDIERHDSPDYMVMLQHQYRMAPGIAALVSDAYEDRLVTPASLLTRPPGPLGPSSLYYLDSSSLASRVELTPRGSRSNRIHASLVGLLLARLVEVGRLTPEALQSVLCITPFVAQADLLRATICSHFGDGGPTVGTIHRCQGREADVVIVDLVDSWNAPVSRFLAQSSPRSEGGRLLTVALTRARRHLVVVADMVHLARNARSGPVTRRLVADLQRLGRRIPPAWILNADAAA